MNSYERYMGMVKGQKVDIVPRTPILMHYAADFVNATYEEFCKDYSIMCKANIALVEEFGFDQLDIMSDPYRETTAWGGQITYMKTTVPRCTSPLEFNKDFNLLSIPALSSERIKNAIKGIDSFRDCGYKKYSITGWVEGPASEASCLRGVENFLTDLLTDEVFICELMDKCTDFAIDFANLQIEHGCDTIGLGDAIASQVGPDIYELLIQPREKYLIETIHNSGGVARLHICGDTNSLLDGISDLDADIVDFDWQVDMEEARRKLGSQVVITGNIDPVKEILNSSPDKIRQAFSSIYKKIGNPYFVNGGCEIPRGTPPENLKALCEPLVVSGF